jgi:hypothetical protein
MEFFSGMREPVPGAALTRSRPPQAIPALESFYGLQS